ncbi:hypothetical protein B0E38_01487 [Streptomyces sp. 111WW2]|uniref:AAA family ATPase n=1 Tax=unclassified Streptomyces TaxID=2593676 RepID=UPI000D0C8A4C|nr:MULTISPECIES: AAA family ATPase [unclassified Streptomyces]MDX3402505.1 hypothetical protein [Streptomyces sp. ME01-18h]PSK58462.1 hypothetical protein B0E38_01487 [Streptomyces sp. 111WW2]
MSGRSNGTVAFAGHRFGVRTDETFHADQSIHLQNFSPETSPAPLCGQLTQIRIHHSEDLFRDHGARLADAHSLKVLPFRGEPYLSSRLGQVRWWRPDPASHLPADHLYARDATGRLHIVLHPRTDRGERYALRVIREVVLRCGEHRGWTAFHAAAATVDGHGILIVGPSGVGKTTLLTALAAHRRADLVGSDRVLVTESAASVVGVPISVRRRHTVRASPEQQPAAAQRSADRLRHVPQSLVYPARLRWRLRRPCEGKRPAAARRAPAAP